jgi:hypothetical protein
MNFNRWRFLLAALAVSIAGCGTRVEMGQVQGTVKIGSQPVPGVLVTFVPAEQVAGSTICSSGQTDEQGRYSLRAESQVEGAVIGKHLIIIEDLAINSAPRDADGTVLKLPPVRFDAKFSSLLDTPLVRDVTAGQQTIDLELALPER